MGSAQEGTGRLRGRWNSFSEDVSKEIIRSLELRAWAGSGFNEPWNELSHRTLSRTQFAKENTSCTAWYLGCWEREREKSRSGVYRRSILPERSRLSYHCSSIECLNCMIDRSLESILVPVNYGTDLLSPSPEAIVQVYNTRRLFLTHCQPILSL